jgi:hypothetical protein
VGVIDQELVEMGESVRSPARIGRRGQIQHGAGA